MTRVAALILAGVIAAAGAEGKAPAVKFVIVFDFTCAGDADYGRQLADSVRVRLRRHKVAYTVIDRLTTAELAPAGGVSLKTADAKVAGMLTEEIGAHIAIFGHVEKTRAGARAEVRCVDISGKKRAVWTKVFSDSSERARGEIAKGVVEAVRGGGEWAPPEYGDETEPKKFARALNANGDFEGGPAGWQKPDNVSMMIVGDRRPGRKGKVLRIFTDLEREAWLKYQRDLRLGKADPKDPLRIGTVGNKYATVAGLEGVHFRSRWIAAAGGQRYWLVADMKGKTAGIFFPKIFVKGFADFSAVADGLSDVSLSEMKLTADAFAKLPPAKRKALIAADARKHPDRYRRMVYNWYLACRNTENVWKHYAAPFPPRGGLPANVKWFRIDVYAYWPPGEFLFDDVHLHKDPRQEAPLPEVKARTPSYKKPSTRPAVG